MKFLGAITGTIMLAATVAMAQPGSTVVADVRAAIARDDFARAEARVAAERASSGNTPLVLEAHSWLGRGALAARRFDKAEVYARQTYEMATAALATRPLDQESHLPIALGAAIEVMAHAAAEQGARSDAVAFLQDELRRYRTTSIQKRLQKNLNLLTLEGTVAPALDLSEHVGGPVPPLDALKGKVVLLFFWAHWCPDCKAQSPILGRLLAKYETAGFTIVAPTQRFGYVAAGRAAGSAEEARYIAEVLATSYPALASSPVPLSTSNHERYGVSTTPTLALIDRGGVIRLYHPGQMSETELEPLVRGLVFGRP